MHRKIEQIELPLEFKSGSGEAPTARHVIARLGTDRLMEESVGYANVELALKQVRRNKGSSGVDGMTVKEHIRRMTSRVGGKSMKVVAAELRKYLTGWKTHFKLADTPSVFRELDGWVRHRLRAVQLKQWKCGTTAYVKLRARGLNARDARVVASHMGHWWKASECGLILAALPPHYFDQLGVPRLAA